VSVTTLNPLCVRLQITPYRTQRTARRDFSRRVIFARAVLVATDLDDVLTLRSLLLWLVGSQKRADVRILTCKAER